MGQQTVDSIGYQAVCNLCLHSNFCSPRLYIQDHKESMNFTFIDVFSVVLEFVRKDSVHSMSTYKNKISLMSTQEYIYCVYSYI